MVRATSDKPQLAVHAEGLAVKAAAVFAQRRPDTGEILVPRRREELWLKGLDPHCSADIIDGRSSLALGSGAGRGSTV